MYVHFAPPCGTASRARLIQNSEQNLPPPLRNDQYPNGVPWLTMGQQIRVDKANNLYSITCRLIRLCEDHQILWSCENPGRSFMWQTTPFQELFSTMQCLSTGLHHCMFGSSRRKLTRSIFLRFTICISCVTIPMGPKARWILGNCRGNGLPMATGTIYRSTSASPAARFMCRMPPTKLCRTRSYASSNESSH